MASLGRAFTKRNKRPDISTPMPFREGSVKYSAGTIRRGQISGPVGLVSCTNMLAYTAPDLRSVSSSSSSLRSGEDSETTVSSLASPVTPFASSESSPVSVEPNHLSSFFPKRAGTVGSTARSSTSSSGADAPSVPTRALSHTKKSHQALARQRSLSRLSPPPSSLSSATATVRSSQESYHGHRPSDQASHPFSRELDKVNEVAEDFGGLPVLDEEEQILLSKGLKKFSAEEYLMEIEELYGGIFEDQLHPLAGASWL